MRVSVVRTMERERTTGPPLRRPTDRRSPVRPRFEGKGEKKEKEGVITFYDIKVNANIPLSAAAAALQFLLRNAHSRRCSFARSFLRSLVRFPIQPCIVIIIIIICDTR